MWVSKRVTLIKVAFVLSFVAFNIKGRYNTAVTKLKRMKTTKNVILVEIKVTNRYNTKAQDGLKLPIRG